MGFQVNKKIIKKIIELNMERVLLQQDKSYVLLNYQNSYFHSIIKIKIFIKTKIIKKISMIKTKEEIMEIK